MKRTVLVVDDQKVNRQILVNILGGEYDIIEAENGIMALNMLKSRKDSISAVVLDIIMPNMDGYEVLKNIQKDPLLSHIPVIVTDQKKEDTAEVRAYSLGAADYITKPFNPEVVAHRLNNLIKFCETAAFANIVERDTLTGLYNKDAFYKKASDMLAKNPDINYEIIVVDIERFKLLNDTYGTAEGDNLLKFIAGFLKRDSDPYNSLTCRYNGDKFIVLYPYSEGYIQRFAERIKKEVKKYKLGMNVTVKLGVFKVIDRTVPVMAMCDRAVLAVGKIKGKYGEYYAYYDDSIRRQLLLEQFISDEMNSALKNGQFKVYIQPKYDIDTDLIVGAESLVRWEHPEKGILSPADFIPHFEKNGFITELDMFIWDKTCEVIRKCIDIYEKYVPVSVNVSRIDLYNPNLCTILLDTISRYKLTPKHLHLEITETAYTKDTKQLIDVVSTLKRHGFVIEMDDFGSGYSSLNMLSKMPIDVLKLDMKFIQPEKSKADSKNILSFIISLAKWMNLAVIAEGVENKEQIDILKSMDCHYVQGYYYSKPLESEKFFELLEKSEVESVPFKMDYKKGDSVTVTKSKNRATMLIVDGILLNRAILREYFSDIYTIAEADNGISAWNYLKKNFRNVSVVMLDLVMPEMDGFKLLEEIKGDSMLKNIPVIVTSQPGESCEARALELGASDFIPKPYNMEVAVKRVHNVMADYRVKSLEREKQLLVQMQKIKREAKMDSLTGLYNRSELENRISDFFKSHMDSGAIFFILDVDNFKIINDTMGHTKGDEALCVVGNILRTCFREEDVISRMGGDEFAIFVPYKFEQDELQRRMLSLCKRLAFDFYDTSITCSIGACSAPDYGRDYQTLYQNSDVALLLAKRMGKNQYQIFGQQTELPPAVLYRNMDWLLDESSDAVFVCDSKSYELLYINSVACKIAGAEKRDCIGKPCYEAIWHRSMPCAHCVKIHKMTNEYCQHEFYADEIKKNYIIKGKIIDWGGKIARIQYIQDNTENAFSRGRLIQLNEKLNGMLQSLQCGIVKCKCDEDFTIIEANDKFYKMTGYSKQEFDKLFNARLSSVVESGYFMQNKEKVHKSRQRSNKCLMESCFITKSGERLMVINCTVKIKESDGKSYYYCTYSDEHEQRKIIEKKQRK